MLQEGLVEEVKKLRERGCRRDMVSMQGLGYKEILGFLEDEYDLERAVYLIKRDTRHFAKGERYLVQEGAGCEYGWKTGI